MGVNFRFLLERVASFGADDNFCYIRAWTLATYAFWWLCSGWDVGFASMTIGEKAVLVLKPSYGYGAEGAGGVIPGNATLLFEVSSRV